MKNSTKSRIANCFIQLVVELTDPRKRVSTTDIVKSLGMDRKSFYRHFENTSDLVIWIFRSELAEILSSPEFESHHLECPDPSLHDAYPDLPFFARAPLIDGKIDQSTYSKAICTMVNGKPEYYKRILTYPCYLDFYYYLLSLFQPSIKSIIELLIGPDHTMPDEEIAFLSEYHTVAYIGRLQYWYVMKRSVLPEDNLERVWNYSCDALKETIERLALPKDA
ncbi:MAG: TetR family transcriptional regulator [Eggerthellaceae bacterium]|nr:TetR family transcriptional regulator [Eggerthellaceae bacterium]